MKITAEIRKIIMELCGDNEKKIMGQRRMSFRVDYVAMFS